MFRVVRGSIPRPLQIDAAIASGEPERRRLSHDCYFPGSTPGRLARLDIDAAIVSQAGMDLF